MSLLSHIPYSIEKHVWAYVLGFWAAEQPPFVSVATSIQCKKYGNIFTGKSSHEWGRVIFYKMFVRVIVLPKYLYLRSILYFFIFFHKELKVRKKAKIRVAFSRRKRQSTNFIFSLKTKGIKKPREHK